MAPIRATAATLRHAVMRINLGEPQSSGTLRQQSDEYLMQSRADVSASGSAAGDRFGNFVWCASRTFAHPKRAPAEELLAGGDVVWSLDSIRSSEFRVYCVTMEAIGQTVSYIAIAVGAVAAASYLSGLLWTIGVAIHHRGAHRPMWLNYAALLFGLAIPAMVVGLVLWGRADWWVLLLFAPFVAMRFFLFRLGSSISHRNQPSRDDT
jgi:hypothetical protein